MNDVNSLKGVRLIGSNGEPTRYYGRLEVFMHGEWGTVCDDMVGNGLARTVCRDLRGGDTLTAQVITNTYNFSVNVPFHIWMDDVRCTGFEASIYDCERSYEMHDCSHKEDVAVNCGPPDILPTAMPINGTDISGNGTDTAGNGTDVISGGGNATHFFWW